MQESYRGYVVYVRTIDLGDGTGWRALVNLERHGEALIDGRLTPVTDVSPTVPVPKIFATESEAENAGHQCGKEMVDERLT